MANENVDLLRGTYEAFGRGDIPAVMANFAEDISWSVPTAVPHGGQANGRAELGGQRHQPHDCDEDRRSQDREHLPPLPHRERSGHA